MKKDNYLELFALILFIVVIYTTALSIAFAYECQKMGYIGGGMDWFTPICTIETRQVIPYEQAVELGPVENNCQ